MKNNINFDQDFLDAILHLKENIESNFNVNIISDISMNILNKYSSDFNVQSRNLIMNLVAMDMGEDFELSKNECLDIVKNILNMLDKSKP
ncbi:MULTISPECIES: hypothetical protein [unclassified Neisseria]|uniref:hypothetical protein n=1 Tax=unclassified Neisseria TaxID=2623750 RepID=UPI0010716E88|nr:MULTISPECIES: hypothetical protein [unclassified Neisseria]MBF0804059.1 hypothetical protein [Neisseria sp. 19428wB4_WF04]TFU43200.1 hypothetical protein E4T99_06770 [Neisseria sp. WF04]